MNIRTLLATTTAVLLTLVSPLAVLAQGNPAVDPVSGLPVTKPFIDPNWTEPDVVATNIDFDNLPLSEIVTRLNNVFCKGKLDVLPFPEGKLYKIDGTELGSARDQSMTLKLHDVHFSDTITAMNLVFENETLPVRWHLEVHNDHPFLILRNEAPGNARLLEKPKVRRVIFIGDLLQIPGFASKGMSFEELNQAVSDLWTQAYKSAPIGELEFHENTQLLVICGTPDQADFVQQVLAALKDRANWNDTHFTLGLHARASGPTNQIDKANPK